MSSTTTYNVTRNYAYAPFHYRPHHTFLTSYQCNKKLYETETYKNWTHRKQEEILFMVYLKHIRRNLLPLITSNHICKLVLRSFIYCSLKLIKHLKHDIAGNIVTFFILLSFFKQLKPETDDHISHETRLKFKHTTVWNASMIDNNDLWCRADCFEQTLKRFRYLQNGQSWESI